MTGRITDASEYQRSDEDEAVHGRWHARRPVTAGICHLCRHLHTGSLPPTCDAYPDGIPAPILYGRADHRAPQPGDQGVTFDALAGVEWEEERRGGRLWTREIGP